MNRTELVTAMSEEAGISKKDADKALSAFISVVGQELKDGGRISLVGFGTFETAVRAAREGTNPLTGKKMSIPATKMPKFKAGKSLKEMIH